MVSIDLFITFHDISTSFYQPYLQSTYVFISLRKEKTFLLTLGKSDPYVEVYQGSKMLHKTAKKNNTLNPKWNEQFNFYMTEKYERIMFKVIF